MQHLPLCLLQYMFDFMPFSDQIAFRKTCKKHYNLYIKDLCNIPSKIAKKITNDVLNQKVYNKLEKLNCSDNTKLTFIPKLETLRTLVCKHNNLIYDLKGLNLTELDCSNNPNIIDISHLKNLKKLTCTDISNISNIVELKNLTELNCTNNLALKNINNLLNLKILKCGGISRVSDISSLVNLEFLYCSNNMFLTNINHLKKLHTLFCCGKSGIKTVSGLNLKYLYAYGNTNF